jgi:hypothetical protein
METRTQLDMPIRDRRHVRTPLRCPVCGGELKDTLVRDLGGVTADLVWEIHAGRCPEHGWFQAEVISRPPREIFAVNKPFGVARRMVVNGLEVYSFPTVWSTQSDERQRQPANPFDPALWQVVVPTASR